jgi:hypothetical protein
MNNSNNKFKFKSLVLILAISSALFSPVRAESASEAVMARAGFLAAQNEVDSIQAVLTIDNPVSFRQMAYANDMVAQLLLEYKDSAPVAIAYFRGRAQAFHLAADIMGEP